ncbi:MAG: alginate export family protein [Candidatus Omnitrophica bacterium]|nr:alginate export family protein [Candidatus Omnitrophota bacterium]
MSRFLKLMSILAIVALIAVPAFAEVQNVKVSGDIDSKMITRNDYDFNNYTSGTNADSDTWFMSTARVQIDADLTDNVSTCVRLLNERDWNQEAVADGSGNTNIALDLASVKMKEMFYAPLTLTIGRQNLRFGNGLVVGDPDSNDRSIGTSIAAEDFSVRKAFDAVRATFDYNPLVLDIVMAKITAGTVGSSKNDDDTDLYGINAAYKFDKYNSEAEAYMFAKNTRAANVESDKIYTYGVRGSLEPISKLVVDGELAVQRGDYRLGGVSIDRSAWAADLGAAYAIDYKWSPKVAARYVYRSGQKTPPGQAVDTDAAAGVTYKAWDTSFEDQTHGIVANQIFDGNNDGVDSNSSIINVMASAVPVQDLTVALDYYYFMLAQKWDTTVTTTRDGLQIRGNKNLGQEVDFSLGYDYTEDVKLGLTAGFFMPGKTFLTDNNDRASTVVANVKVAF